MTPKEALDYFKYSNIEDIPKSAFNVAIEALEKQIPKKPLWVQDGFRCPSCNAFYLTPYRTLPKYCNSCGRKIDWSEEE